ncbi:MAG: hypothetical protein ACTHM5_07135 [Ginsengibacter sp.]
MNQESVFTHKQIEKLRNEVVSFIKDQPGYEKFDPETLGAFQDGTAIGVLFGDNLQDGIAGFGINEDEAYEDFVRSWHDLNGFEWMKANK